MGEGGETSWEKGCRKGMRLQMSRATPVCLASTGNALQYFYQVVFKKKPLFQKVSKPKNFSILCHPSGLFYNPLGSWMFLLILSVPFNLVLLFAEKF